MNITQHLMELERRGLSNESITAIVLRIKQRLAEYWQADMNTPQTSMLLSHFAYALGRIQRGYPVEALYCEFVDEIENSLYFAQISTIHQDLLSCIPFSIPVEEQTYLLANIYSLILAQPQILQHLRFNL